MNSEYNQVFVILDDCLVTVKSGARFPKNIADFMPDYNLWYALKFMNPGEVVVIENTDLSRTPQSYWFDLKIEFISEWLSEIIKTPVRHGYSYHGNWKYLYGYPGDKNLIEFLQRQGKILFIDKNTRENEKYIKSEKEIEYMSKDEFILKYNKNPRKYQKIP